MLILPITESEVAISKAIVVLRRIGYLFYGGEPMNKGRYYILNTTDFRNNPRILLMYKKEWLRSYGKLTGKKEGYGETINREHLKKALEKRCTIVARTDGKEVWIADLRKFFSTGTRRFNKAENKDTIMNSAKIFKNIKDFRDLQEIIVWVKHNARTN